MHRGGLPTFGHAPSQWSIGRESASVGAVQRDVVVERLTNELVDQLVLRATKRLDERVGVAGLVEPAAAEEVSARELQDPALEGRGVVKEVAVEPERRCSIHWPIDAIRIRKGRPAIPQ